ncbi:helix-turn-helix domain-containing protein [Chloroflexota bacterium]
MSKQQSLISISEASRILGVSEVTLRQWTDEGKVKAFVTPGGHRRYSRNELRQFMGSQHRIHSVKDLVAELKDAPSQQHEIARTYFANTSWYSRLTRETQEHFAETGRRLVNLVIRYVAEPSKRDETLELAREVGWGFGKTLAQLELSLTDTIQAFILHRDPVVNAATRLLRGREALNERAAEAVPLISHVMDEVLMSLVKAHEETQNRIQNDDTGGDGQ